MHSLSRAVVPLLLLAACARPSSNAATREPAPVFAVGDTVQLFAPGIVSTGDVFASSFTPDGRTVFFTQATADRSRMQIMVSRWQAGRWQKAEPAEFSTGQRQMDPHVSPDGKTLYFTAPRRRDAVLADADGDWDTWQVRLDVPGAVAERVNGRLRLANSAENEMYPSITYSSPSSPYSEQLFFGVRKKDAAPGTPGEIQYIGPKIRTTPVPVVLDKSISNPSNPYITPDGSVLIVSATGSDPRKRADLYVIRRREDGRWMDPQSLGAEVNTNDVEFCPQLSRDAQYLFFSRVHYDADRATGNDIYVVPTRFIRPLRDALQAR